MVEYYAQQIDLKDKSLVESFVDELPGHPWRAARFQSYWNNEHEEIKYQIG